MTPVEPAVLSAARHGDPVALERLLAQCRPNAHRYALRTCSVSVAEDAVQESLLLVCRYLPSLRSALSFDGWLAKIVRRECLRLARRFGAPADTAGIVEELPEPLAQRPDYELRFDIALAIQSLPAIYRDVILLRDFEELTLREIAGHLNTPVETAKTRLYRGRTLIREYLLAGLKGGAADA